MGGGSATNGGSTSPGNGGSTSPGNGGSTSPGNGGSTSPGNGGSTSPGNGGTPSTAGTNATAGSGTGGAPPVGSGAGYWTQGNLHGCSWTGVDVVAGTTTMSTPKDFTMKAAADPYCVSGTVHGSYESVALLGFNLNEPAGANCAYKPVDVTAMGPPAVTLTGTGLAVNFTKKTASTLRVQIQGPKGASDPNDRWCYTITEPTGPIFAPFNKFNTKCWEVPTAAMPATGVAYAGQPISAVVFLVPGTPVPTPFNYCINGFAPGTSVADAPAGGSTGGVLMGSIGGPGMDQDFARVKVAAGGKSYIIQNNNWGNPTGTDQKITYAGNSFTIDSSTGTKGGAGEPASFPSIYIGANGNTANGVFSTSSDDGLPKQISTIGTINTTFRYNRAMGDYNACYDVWFSAQRPTAPYNDAISGFVMVWLYKPANNFPISSGNNMPIATGVTVPGVEGTWDVWVGPRGGAGPNSAAPVVSYVRTQTTLAMTFNLKAFITHAAAHGIQPSWYLTDVFAGFEIWQGSAATGLKVEEFTAVVN
ncbi:MAG TPA: hypothetical protein VER33_08320 [Polyangiaceae bacterium]|nr:hypothetical protein [Polyangiaceae bacterium]